jgi:2-oxoacid:acceptor oxidoreductase gamma subunit (pyruvate/2-ketoisovalerate family)
MIEIRLHGRGGQGAVIAGKILAAAVFRDGMYAQSFPAFGVERRGAPVTAFTRIDKETVNLRCEIYEPDHIVVLDPTLMEGVNVTAGLREGGIILVNSEDDAGAFEMGDRFRVATVDASGIAVRNRLGTRTTPIVNTAILGAFARVTGLVTIDSVVEAIREGVPVRPDENAAAARNAYDEVRFEG